MGSEEGQGSQRRKGNWKRDRAFRGGTGGSEVGQGCQKRMRYQRWDRGHWRRGMGQRED